MMAILYDLLYMIPLCLIAVGVGRYDLGVPEKGIGGFVIALLGVGVCVLLKHWKNRLKFLAPGILLALGAGVALIQKPEKRGEFLFQNQWILWVFLAAVACFFAGWLLAESRLARRILAAATFVGLLVIMGFWSDIDKMAVALALFLLVVVLADEVQLRWEKSGYVDGKGHLVSIAPFLILLSLCVAALPAPENPYDWNFAVKIWERASSVVKLTGRWFGGNAEEYGGVVGFDDDGSFWGNLSKRSRDNMTLTGSKDAGDVVYLAGKTMDLFDGRSWQQVYVEENRDRMMDTLETISAVVRHDPEYLRNYLWRVSVRLKYEDFNTRYLFTPLKSILGANKISDIAFTQKGADLIAEKGLGYGTEYEVTFFKINQGHSVFRDLVEDAGVPDAENWEIVRYQYEPTEPYWEKNEGAAEKYVGTSYEDYLSYVDRIYEHYLQEVTISEELAPYVEKWLEGAETDYEKLCRIESALSGLEYSLSPGAMPEEVSTPEGFLDYFLLDSQKGYCTHFATAFVLLARSQGIPARYTQGFYVNKGDAESVTVTSGMAHSWPEAYIKGIGWIQFEPTPGKKNRPSWLVVKKAAQTSPSESLQTHEDEEEKEELLPAKEQEKKGFAIQWRVILIPPGLVLAFLLAFLLIDRAVIRARYRKLDETGRFRVNCRKNLKVLELLGWKLSQGETLEEFAKRAREGVPAECLGFLGDCELAAYAGRVPTAETTAKAEEELKRLLAILREQKGKRYYWYLFLIGRMEGEKNRS